MALVERGQHAPRAPSSGPPESVTLLCRNLPPSKARCETGRSDDYNRGKTQSAGPDKRRLCSRRWHVAATHRQGFGEQREPLLSVGAHALLKSGDGSQSARPVAIADRSRPSTIKVSCAVSFAAGDSTRRRTARGFGGVIPLIVREPSPREQVEFEPSDDPVRYDPWPHRVENIPNHSHAITWKAFSVLSIQASFATLRCSPGSMPAAGPAGEPFTPFARGGQRNVRVYAQQDPSLPAAKATLDTPPLPTVDEISWQVPRPSDSRRFCL
jgi:hypothetical protein